MADKVEMQRVDLSNYRQIKITEFDSQHPKVNELLESVNTLLTNGWELIDARVAQWARPISPKRAEEPPMLTQWAVYAFILGKR
jgi:hypothetical protein